MSPASQPVHFMAKLLTIILMMMTLAGCERKRTPCIYEIPKGFTGWVLIEFNKIDCPPLPMKDGKSFFQIGKDGRLCTSSSPAVGRANDEYYYAGGIVIKVTGPSDGGLIWGASTGTSQAEGQKEINYENFYVGTEDQFKKANERPRP